MHFFSQLFEGDSASIMRQYAYATSASCLAENSHTHHGCYTYDAFRYIRNGRVPVSPQRVQARTRRTTISGLPGHIFGPVHLDTALLRRDEVDEDECSVPHDSVCERKEVSETGPESRG
jgi:hypothetical protein